MNAIRKVILTTLIFMGWAAIFPSQLYVAGWQEALLGAVVLGLLNALVRPLIKLLSLPLTIVTFGLFLLVINGLMLNLMTWFVSGIVFSSFGATVILAAVISFVNVLFDDSRR